MNRYGQTVCLNMIVKDEAPVIARCLTSVRPLIDSWVIVDTGSTDGTQEIVRDVLADLPGELIERPWRDFGSNRTEALQQARGRADYVFVIDADEVLELDADFRLPRLTADVYIVTIALDRWTYPRRQLVRDALPWRYEGVLHEYIVCEQARSEAELKGIRTIPYQDGSRSRDPNTYRRDALCLEEALIDDPDNSRYVFYLAQSYRDARDPESALRHYQRRAEMPGWREETWYALYQIALVKEALEHPWPEVLEAYLEAFELVPDRAEPLFRIWVALSAPGPARAGAHLPRTSHADPAAGCRPALRRARPLRLSARDRVRAGGLLCRRPRCGGRHEQRAAAQRASAGRRCVPGCGQPPLQPRRPPSARPGRDRWTRAGRDDRARPRPGARGHHSRAARAGRRGLSGGRGR